MGVAVLLQSSGENWEESGMAVIIAPVVRFNIYGHFHLIFTFQRRFGLYAIYTVLPNGDTLSFSFFFSFFRGTFLCIL